MKLEPKQVHILRLARKDAEKSLTGWAKVSDAVWRFFEAIPDRLLERRVDEDGTKWCRLTHDGETVVDFS